MRYLYDKHKKDLPQVDPNNVSSGEGEESDNEEREVKFFWLIITNFKLNIHSIFSPYFESMDYRVWVETVYLVM